MAKIYWSRDGETFDYSELAELIDGHGLKEGDIVYFGDRKDHNPKKWVNAASVIEMIGEASCEDAPEYAADYPDVTPEQVLELQALLEAWVSKLPAPTFYAIVNIKPYTITKTDTE